MMWRKKVQDNYLRFVFIGYLEHTPCVSAGITD